MKIPNIIDKVLKDDIEPCIKYFNKVITEEDELEYIKKYFANEKIFYKLFEADFNYYKLESSILNNIDALINGSKWEIGLGVFAIFRRKSIRGNKLIIKYLDIIYNFINSDNVVKAVIRHNILNYSTNVKLCDLLDSNYLLNNYLCSQINPLIVYDALSEVDELEGSLSCGYNLIDILCITYYINNDISNVILKFVINKMVSNRRKFNSKVISSLLNYSIFTSNELLTVLNYAVSKNYITDLQSKPIIKVIMTNIL